MDDDFEIRLRRPGAPEPTGPSQETEPDDPTEAHDPVGPRRRDVWGRRLRRAGIGMLVISAACLLLAGGWLVRGLVPSGGVDETTITVERPVRVDAPATRDGTLPNVLGLSLEEARQVYADAGAEVTRIKVSQTPYVGREGTVVRQDPPAASKIGTRGALTLVTSEQARMPDLRGVPADEARRRLGDMGIGATVVVRYVPRAQLGAVARTRPAAGDIARARATLVVSEAASSVALASLESVDGDCSVGDGDLDGRTVSDAVVCSPSSGGGSTRQSYEVNDRVTAFKARVGLDTNAPGSARVTLIVRQGASVVGTYALTSSPREIDVPLSGSRRVVLEVRRADDGADSASAVLENARLAGARSGIDDLSETP